MAREQEIQKQSDNYPNIAEEIARVRTLNEELNQENKDLNDELEHVKNLQGQTKYSVEDNGHALSCKECSHWKSQTVSLATKYFETIKGMKTELRYLRKDAIKEIHQGKKEIKHELADQLKTVLENTKRKKKPSKSRSRSKGKTRTKSSGLVSLANHSRSMEQISKDSGQFSDIKKCHVKI